MRELLELMNLDRGSSISIPPVVASSVAWTSNSRHLSLMDEEEEEEFEELHAGNAQFDDIDIFRDDSDV